LIEEATAGDPMSRQKWLRGSLRHLRQKLEEQGYKVSLMTLRRLLVEQDYSLKSNQKEVTEDTLVETVSFAISGGLNRYS
jgi:deoxyribodipyrimidine photolyase